MVTEKRHQCVWTAKGCSGSVEDGQQVPSKTEAPETICTGCYKSLERAVAEIPETWCMLHAAIGNKGLRTGQRVSGSRSLPININVDVDRLKVALVDWLTAAGARVAEALNLDDDPHPVSSIDAEHNRIVHAACRLLGPNIDKLLASEASAVMVWRQHRSWDNDHEEWWRKDALTPEDWTGIEIANELVRTNRWGRRMLNSGEKQEHSCPLCLQRSVYRIVAWSKGGTTTTDIVECRECRKTWSWDSYLTICNVALRAIEEEQVEAAEREELEELRYLIKGLPELEERLALAEAKAARFERGFQAALEPEFTTMSARDFAETVLRETA